MKKVEVNCGVAYVFAEGVYNNEVVYPLPDYYYEIILYTCRRCGELFVRHIGDVKTKSIEFPPSDFALKCPQCDSLLIDTLVQYPKTFITPDGKVGHYNPSSDRSLTDQNKVCDIWSLNEKDL